MLAALFLVAFACFRLGAIRPIRLFARVTDAGFFFGNLSLFGLTQPGIGQRVRAGAALFFGEGA